MKPPSAQQVVKIADRSVSGEARHGWVLGLLALLLADHLGVLELHEVFNSEQGIDMTEIATVIAAIGAAVSSFRKRR